MSWCASCFFVLLIFLLQQSGPVDIRLWAAYGSAAKEYDDRGAFLGQVNAIPRPPIEHILADSAQRFDVGRIPLRHPDNGFGDLPSRVPIEAIGPLPKWIRLVRTNIFFDDDSHLAMVFTA